MLRYRPGYFKSLDDEAEEHVFLLPCEPAGRRRWIPPPICDEMMDWCREWLGDPRDGRWSTCETSRMIYFLVRDDDDAVYFRLRWG